MRRLPSVEAVDEAPESVHRVALARAVAEKRRAPRPSDTKMAIGERASIAGAVSAHGGVA